MASSDFIRWCGLAAILGGATHASLALVGLLIRYVYAPQSEAELPPVLQSLALLSDVSSILLLVAAIAAIAGLHALQREHYGLVGMLSFLAPFIGVAVILVGAVADVLAGQRYPAIALILIAGALIASVGLLMFGAATIRAGVLSWWVGVLVILGSPLAYFAYIVAATNLLPVFDDIAGAVVVGVAWALVGYALLRQLFGVHYTRV